MEGESRKPIIRLTDIRKNFFIGTPNELKVLKGIDLTVYEGEFIAVVGASGSGKSTLMNIIGALDRPTSGGYILDDVDVIPSICGKFHNLFRSTFCLLYMVFCPSKVSITPLIGKPTVYSTKSVKNQV